MRIATGAWFRILRSVIAVLLAVAVASMWPGKAHAHSYWENNANLRLYGCALAAKYGCQAHYLRLESNAFGSYYIDRHAHGCTTSAGEISYGEKWQLFSLAAFYRWGDSNPAWGVYHQSHWHTDEWCEASQPSHGGWYPNVQQLFANNQYWVNTLKSATSIGTSMNCKHQVVNFAGVVGGQTFSTHGHPHNVSPIGDACQNL